MKKLLLSIITMMVSVVLVNATDVKFDFATDTYGLTRYSNSEKTLPTLTMAPNAPMGMSLSHCSKPRAKMACAFGPMVCVFIRTLMPDWK